MTQAEAEADDALKAWQESSSEDKKKITKAFGPAPLANPAWGIVNAHPRDALAVYGARAIDHGSVFDILWDRAEYLARSHCRQAFGRWLNAVGAKLLRDAYAEKLPQGPYAEEILRVSTDEGLVVGLARPCGGYVHLVVWLEPA